MSEKVTPITKLVEERDFFRINGELYLYYEALDEMVEDIPQTKNSFFPTFEFEEEDYLGLSLDALRENLLYDVPEHNEYYLKFQELLVLMKRYMDAKDQDLKRKTYKKSLVNISGSGLSFLSDVHFNEGDFLLMSLFFPIFPYSHVRVCAEILKSTPKDSEFDIKVKFVNLSEGVQDEILKFVNQCQREQRFQKE